MYTFLVIQTIESILIQASDLFGADGFEEYYTIYGQTEFELEQIQMERFIELGEDGERFKY